MSFSIQPKTKTRQSAWLVCALVLCGGCAAPELTTVPDTLAWDTSATTGTAREKTRLPKRSGPMVVVHYGDSHSSIPAMPSTLRDLLADGEQTSPGFVAPEHHTPEANVGVKGSWKKHNWIYGNHKGPFGPLGVAWSIRQANGQMNLRIKAKSAPTQGIKVTALYARQPGHLPFELRAGDKVLRTVSPDPGAGDSQLGTAVVELPAGEVRLQLKTVKGGTEKGGPGLRFFGFLVQYADSSVEYDAFGVVGARIRSPSGRSDATMDEYLSLRDPDMLVMWYGSNSAYNKRLNLKTYGQQYLELLQAMRKRAPNAACVAVGPPDLGRTGGSCRGNFVANTIPKGYVPPDQRRAAPSRRKNVDVKGRVLKRRRGRKGSRGRKLSRRRVKRMSEEASLPEMGEDFLCEGEGPIPGIVRAQREAAYKAGCAYFDTFAWMGGPGSMQRWARHKPRLAAGDMVHLTISGYKAVAKGIHDTLPDLRRAAPSPPPPPASKESSTARCPKGARYQSAEGLCIDDDEALGPFPSGMQQWCESKGGAGCKSARWELETAKGAYGEASCPSGSKLDPRLGYCVDHRYAYGPFEADHIAHCQSIGGGDACQTLRWSRAITPARPMSMATQLLPQRQQKSAPIHKGVCAVKRTDLQMVWRSCAGRLDCYQDQHPETGRRRRMLRLPSVGPVAKEAHLVTIEDQISGYPQGSRQFIKAHYARSQALTGYTMRRSEAWAPAGEGGCEFGQGASPGKVPMVAEAWYINMFWRKRPPRGTRMIVTNPVNGRSVVAAAGYETGPGSNEVMAGVTEEIHHYLGTGHRGKLRVAFAVDQTLPFGPIECND